MLRMITENFLDAKKNAAKRMLETLREDRQSLRGIKNRQTTDESQGKKTNGLGKTLYEDASVTRQQ